MEHHILGYETFPDGTKIPIYIPQLNFQDPWNQRVVAVLSDDILKYRALTQKWYKESSFRNLTNSCFLFLNHPLKVMRICGLVLGWRWKVINQQEHAVWSLDDCSNNILCSCSRSQLLGSHAGVHNLTGRTICATGTFDCDRFEFKVEEIEILPTLKEEIIFWKSALRNRRALREPWVPAPDILRSFYNESPAAVKAAEDFVANLNESHFREYELEIASPYREHSQAPSDDYLTGVSSSSFESGQISCGEICKELADPHLPVTRSRTVPSKSLKTLKKRLLTWYLLKCETVNFCKFHAAAKDPKITCLLDELSVLQCKHESLPKNTKTLKSQREKIYRICINELMNLNLIAEVTGNLNLENLSLYYRYIKMRLQSLINMHIPSCVLKYEQVRTMCNLPLLSNTVILNTCKHFLDYSPMGDLLEWWVDPLSEDKIKLHFVFKPLSN